MADQESNENKATTPAQGAGGSAEKVDQPIAEQLTPETPQYIAELLKSNAEVIASNQLVIEAIGDFKETGGKFLKEAVQSINVGKADAAAKPQSEPVEIDPKAKYVVAKDMGFRDSKNFTKQYKPGDDVSDFEVERLARLVQIGHVVKKSK